ncbi:MAG: Hsp20/alpha crystallin family protein [Pseudomonadota bacterium]
MSEQQTERSPSLPSVFGGPSMFRSLQEEMDRMFHAFSLPQMSWQSGAGSGSGALGLRVDIGETDKEIHVQADLPGVTEDEVEVTLEDDVLHIRAEKKIEADRTEKKMRVVERSHGLFERAIRMPAGIEPEKVTASFDKGVLSVTLPKPPEVASSSRRIAIGKAS